MKKIIIIALLTVSCSHLKWAQKNCDIVNSLCYIVDTMPSNSSSTSYVEKDTFLIVDTITNGVSFNIKCDSFYNPIITSLTQYSNGLRDELSIKENKIKYLVNYPQKIVYKTIKNISHDTIYKKFLIPNVLNEKIKKENVKLKMHRNMLLFLSLILIIIIMLYLFLKKFII